MTTFILIALATAATVGYSLYLKSLKRDAVRVKVRSTSRVVVNRAADPRR